MASSSSSSSSSSTSTTTTHVESCYITTVLLFLISFFFLFFFSIPFLQTVVVNNWLEKRIPQPVRPPQRDMNNININKEEEKKYQQSKLIRRAIIGFCSSFVSDCISNGIRVIKTYKQTSDDAPITYADAIIELYHQSNNSISFLYRGLELKLLCNCLSGILFSILWKMFMERMNNNNNNNNNDANNNNSNNAPSLTTNSDSMYSNSGREQRTNSNDESSPLLRD
jgi:hypothetical protein